MTVRNGGIIKVLGHLDLKIILELICVRLLIQAVISGKLLEKSRRILGQITILKK